MPSLLHKTRIYILFGNEEVIRRPNMQRLRDIATETIGAHRALGRGQTRQEIEIEKEEDYE